MARWQRHARLGLGLFAMAFAVALWFLVGERQAPASAPIIPRLDPKAVSEIRGGDVLQHKGATRDIRVEFGSQIGYDDGRTKFTSFTAFIDDRGGRSFVISGNEAWVGSGLSSYDVRGDVALETSDGLTARTPAVTFTEAEGVVRGSGPVQFQRGRVTGSGVGFTYERSLDRLWLQQQAAIQVAPGPDGGGMRVTAGTAGYSRTERFLRFERGTRLERDGQIIEAEQSTVFLRRDRDEPELVELRGGARVTGAGGASSLQAMEARDINLRYGPDGRALEQALLVGQGRIQLASSAGAATQDLQAVLIDASLAPDGAVTRLVARDQVRVSLPGGGTAPPRVITAPLLDAAGEPGRGLTAMTFSDGVEYREAAAAGPERVARARTLQAALTPAGTVEQADFSGGFRFEEGRLSAASSEASYQVTQGTLALRSPGGPPLPHTADERVIIDGETIDVTLSPRQLTAAGKVSAQFLPGRRAGDRGTSLLSEREAVLVTADRFVYDEATGAGSYTGKAVLWQQGSGTSIRGDAIELNDRTGVLTATGGVVTTLPIGDATETAAAGAPTTSVARAGRFHFDDARRLATFEEQAQLDGSQGNLHAARIELFLAPEGNTLERLEAARGVKILIDTRQATGQQLTYHPADQRYVLTGAPVRLVQACQESTGRTLTFYRSSDRIQVDGNEEIRVQTRGGKCPDPPGAAR